MNEKTPAEYLGLSDDIAIEYLDERTNKEIDRYYELIIDADEMEPPIISVEKYNTFDEVRDKPGILACGGVAFILFRIRGSQREIVASNCSAHETDGWIDEGRLEWETEEVLQKLVLQRLAEEAMERHPEYIKQMQEKKLRQEIEDEKKCDEIIEQCRANLRNMKYP